MAPTAELGAACCMATVEAWAALSLPSSLATLAVLAGGTAGRPAGRFAGMRESADAEQFLVQAITGAAMVLGEWWSYDRISYSAVKLGTQRLEELVFEIADERSPEEIAALIRRLGYEPVWKDWDAALSA